MTTSDECNQSIGVAVFGLCAMCGKRFQKKLTGRYGKSRKYCSAECAREKLLQTRLIDQASHEDHRKQVGACEHCGKEYRIRRQKDGMRKYCTAKCKNDAAKVVDKICERCGKSFKGFKRKSNRFCSTECYSVSESERFAMQREAKRTADEKKRVEFRHQSALRLSAFRKLKSAVAVAKQFGEPDNTTHNYIDGCRGYKRIQKLKTVESKWRITMTKAGRISTLFPKERLFCQHLENLLRKAVIPFLREADVPGPTGRRVDFLIKDLYRMWIVEAKNSSHTSDVDCCVGQAMVRALAFKGVPVVAFPSDLEIDATARAACESLGVVFVTELDIIQKWCEYGK